MTQDPRIRDVLYAVAAAAGIFALVAFAMPAFATQPECTGDRHYDSEATGCCPNVPSCPEPETCAPVLPCPDPAPCPDVQCKDGADGTTTVVEVDRCPEPEVSEVCKVRRDGTVVCPRSKKARRNGNGGRRILVPRSIIDKIADVKGY